MHKSFPKPIQNRLGWWWGMRMEGAGWTWRERVECRGGNGLRGGSGNGLGHGVIGLGNGQKPQVLPEATCFGNLTEWFCDDHRVSYLSHPSATFTMHRFSCPRMTVNFRIQVSRNRQRSSPNMPPHKIPVMRYILLDKPLEMDISWDIFPGTFPVYCKTFYKWRGHVREYHMAYSACPERTLQTLFYIYYYYINVYESS